MHIKKQIQWLWVLIFFFISPLLHAHSSNDSTTAYHTHLYLEENWKIKMIDLMDLTKGSTDCSNARLNETLDYKAFELINESNTGTENKQLILKSPAKATSQYQVSITGRANEGVETTQCDTDLETNVTITLFIYLPSTLINEANQVINYTESADKLFAESTKKASSGLKNESYMLYSNASYQLAQAKTALSNASFANHSTLTDYDSAKTAYTQAEIRFNKSILEQKNALLIINQYDAYSGTNDKQNVLTNDSAQGTVTMEINEYLKVHSMKNINLLYVDGSGNNNKEGAANSKFSGGSLIQILGNIPMNVMINKFDLRHEEYNNVQENRKLFYAITANMIHIKIGDLTPNLINNPNAATPTTIAKNHHLLTEDDDTIELYHLGTNIYHLELLVLAQLNDQGAVQSPGNYSGIATVTVSKSN